MEMKLIISSADCGATVGEIIKKKLCLSSRLLSKVKRCGQILLNEAPVTVRATVKTDDLLEIILPEEGSENIVPTDIELDIVFEDESFLIVNKPAKMSVHPTLNDFENTLGNAVCYYFKDKPFVFRPVNRLDKDTTGMVVIAKNQYIASEFSKQLQNGTFKKTYYGVTQGIPHPSAGVIDAPIRREAESIITRCVAPDGQRAVTKYKVIAQKQGRALLQLNLLTGRTHQIRVHLAHIGTPLYADYLYGTEVSEEHFLLHCRKLQFHHPENKKAMEFDCPSPFEKDFL